MNDNMNPGSGRMYGESNIINIADAIIASYRSQFGMDGIVNITGTAAATPATGKVFVSLQVFADAVVDTIVETDATGSIPTDTALTVGTVLYGKFTSVKLKSGKVRAYQGVAL